MKIRIFVDPVFIRKLIATKTIVPKVKKALCNRITTLRSSEPIILRSRQSIHIVLLYDRKIRENRTPEMFLQS